MTSNQLDLPRAAAAPGRVGQGTTVEQSRAVAEVQAQVIVAQQFPRSTTRSLEAMEEACKQPALAGRALFRYPRGRDDDGKANILSGPSVHLARELARCWGNVQYGLVELLRDDVHGQSEVMAWAWDMEANMRSSTTFIVPHRRDTKKGVKELVELRDIYENNANMGGRRMREMIFAVLPNWFTSRALEVCAETNEKGGGIPLAQRRVNAVKKLEEYRVSPARIAAKYGYSSVDQLTATDLAQLAIIYGSLQQNTVSVDDEFPPEPSAAPDLLAGADTAPAGRRQRKPPAAKPAAQAAAAPEDDAPWPDGASVHVPAPADGARVTIDHPALDSPEYKSALAVAQAQAKRLFEGDRAVRLEWASRVLRTENPVMSFGHLTINELQVLGDTFARCQNVAQLERLIAEGTVPGGE